MYHFSSVQCFMVEIAIDNKGCRVFNCFCQISTSQSVITSKNAMHLCLQVCSWNTPSIELAGWDVIGELPPMVGRS